MMATAWLVVNADDLGVSKGATLGILKAYREGIVTSASLAPTTPFYTHALETCVYACPDLGIGLHFTLTSGVPVSDLRQVPLLVDTTGQFRWRFVTLLAAAGIQKQPALLEQIEIELEAQLTRLISDGIRPDHINGERHVHLIPGIFECVVAAAQRHRIHYVRIGRDIGNQYFSARDTPGIIHRLGFAKSWLLSRLSTKKRAQLAGKLTSPDHVASYLYTGRTDIILPRLMGTPVVAGVTEVMVHPGLPEENGPLALGNRELERYLMSPDRRAELDACIAARTLPSGWRLTNYRQLAAEVFA